jgi:hypothetical protein
MRIEPIRQSLCLRFAAQPDLLSARVILFAMNELPESEIALIVRTDFSDEVAWEKTVSEAQNPADPFVFNMEFVDDHEYDGATVEQLIKLLPADFPHAILFVADKTTISHPERPILVVDLAEQRGQTFRSLPAEIASIENNLSIGNMGFEEFSDSADEHGIFRGFAGA